MRGKFTESLKKVGPLSDGAWVLCLFIVLQVAQCWPRWFDILFVKFELGDTPHNLCVYFFGVYLPKAISTVQNTFGLKEIRQSYEAAGKVVVLQAMKASWERTIIAPLILHLVSRWRWTVISMPQLPYSQETIPVPIEQEAGWSSDPVWTLKKRKISCALEFKPQVAQPILQSLYRLRCPVISSFHRLKKIRVNAFHGFVESCVRLYFMNYRRPKIGVWCRNIICTVRRLNVYTIPKKTGNVWRIMWYFGMFLLCL